MTETERKAMALVNDIERERGESELTPNIMRGLVMDDALCRAIEQHEAFRQEVSDAVGRAIDDCGHDGMKKAHISSRLHRFIIAKPDPLVEAWDEAWKLPHNSADKLAVFRAAVEARGGKIVWGEG